MSEVLTAAVVECGDRSTREINAEIKQLIAAGATEIAVTGPGARHNLAVGVLSDVEISFDGSVGYYCGGLGGGATITVAGNAGWGLGESMLNGSIEVQGNAGNGAGAAMRDGQIVIHGNASARAGVSLKGGNLIIGGDCGYMTGFMAQKGTIIVCGNAGEALADSMYEGTVYIGGEIADLGNDAVIHEPTAEELGWLETTLSPYDMAASQSWKKVIAGRKLWNFDKKESLWREAL